MMQMKKSKLSILSAFLLTLSSLTMTAQAAQAQTKTTVDIKPVSASTCDNHTTSWFCTHANASQTIKTAVDLINKSDKTQTVELKALSATTAEDGGIAYIDDHKSWITNLPSQVTIPAHATKRVDYHIDVPASARCGDHLYAVAAVTTQNDKNTESGVINIVTQRVMSVHVIVDKCPAEYFYTFDSAKYDAEHNRVIIQGTVHNYYIPRVHKLEIAVQKDNKTYASLKQSDVEYAPESSFTYVIYPKNALQAGSYIVSITADDHTYTLSFTVTAQQAKQAQQVLQSQIQTQNKINLSLIMLFIALLIIAAGIAIWERVKFNRYRREIEQKLFELENKQEQNTEQNTEQNQEQNEEQQEANNENDNNDSNN